MPLQNGMDKMVYGQNGIGQKGMDKKVVYGQNGSIRTKWYGQNGSNLRNRL